jgi:hypothetical protein
MKAARSLTLILALMTSALPVSSQERIDRTTGPIGRAIALEAVRLAADGEPPSSSIETVQQRSKPAEPSWSRVRQLAPGTEIIVTVKGSKPANRYFLAGDESDLMVLNVADPALPVAARDMLRDAVSIHPKPIPGAPQAGTKNVRVGPDGVFVGNQRVADLGQVEHIARDDVTEIKTPPKSGLQRYWESGLGRGFTITAAGILAGSAIGIGVGLVANKTNGCDRCPLAGLFYGGIAGGVIGKVLAYRWAASHDVIYRAP